MKTRWHINRLSPSIAGALVMLAQLFGNLCDAVEMTWEFSVQVSVVIQGDPPVLSFSWPQDEATAPDYYTVCRKGPGEPVWGEPVLLPGSTTNYVDTDVTMGRSFEYQFYKHTSTHVGYGYITAGIQIPLQENRGKLILLVDQTFSALLAKELQRLQEDLVGDGWQVLRHDIPRTMAVPEVKAIIAADYHADSAQVKGLFLFGRIPVPYSGDAAPDGHFLEHKGAWPADTFYGEFDGVWTDTEVNDTTSGSSSNWNRPGDGKYDQSEIPGTVRLQIGRVDLANMPGLETDGQPSFPSEGELLRRYLNKDHNYRHKVFSLPKVGVVYNETGDRGGEAFAADAWRNWAPLLGPPPVSPIGAGVFLPLLETTGFQWSYATGGGATAELAGLGGKRGSKGYYQSGTTLDVVDMDPKTSFVMLLGSTLGDWDRQDNIMRAFLATPTCGLACVYAGRPHWYFHPMGIGETLGYCAQLTQNNHADGLYRNQSNNFAGFVHTALLGDPTLREHVLSPPQQLSVALLTNGSRLSWSPPAESVDGYYVYRCADAGPFTRLTPSLLQDTQFVDSAWTGAPLTYMVRAVKLQVCPSGSYFNASQGVFAGIGQVSSLRLERSGEALRLSWAATPGKTYRVLWSPALTSSAAWLPLGSQLIAGEPQLQYLLLSGAQKPSPTDFTPWADDSLPLGAVAGLDSEPWTWVAGNPSPFSGAAAVQSSVASGLHQLDFTFALATMPVNGGDLVCAQVYLDPDNPPHAIMLQWHDGVSWEHRALWGTNDIGYGIPGTPSCSYQGPLPPLGVWYPLEVPAESVGLAGTTVTGVALTQLDGRATWDLLGKRSPRPGIVLDPAHAQGFLKVLVFP